MEVPKEILKEIADYLQMGYKCFIHRDTFEVVSYLDEEDYPDLEPEDWKEVIDRVKNDRKKFSEIEKMDSRQSFSVMTEFAESLENNSTKIKLYVALEGRKPFANFKFQIEQSGKYREMWFDFKNERYMEWVREQLSIESL